MRVGHPVNCEREGVEDSRRQRRCAAMRGVPVSACVWWRWRCCQQICAALTSASSVCCDGRDSWRERCPGRANCDACTALELPRRHRPAARPTHPAADAHWRAGGPCPAETGGADTARAWRRSSVCARLPRRLHLLCGCLGLWRGSVCCLREAADNLPVSDEAKSTFLCASPTVSHSGQTPHVVQSTYLRLYLHSPSPDSTPHLSTA